jgi:hypothetical protein
MAKTFRFEVTVVVNDQHENAPTEDDVESQLRSLMNTDLGEDFLRDFGIKSVVVKKVGDA